MPVSPRVARMELIDDSSMGIVDMRNVSRHGMCLSGIDTLEVGARVNAVGTGILRGASTTATVAWRVADHVGLHIERFADKKSEHVWLTTLLDLHDAHLHDVLRHMEKNADARNDFLALIDSGERLREERLRRHFARAMSIAVHDLANPVSSAYSTMQLLTTGIIGIDQFMQDGMAAIVERNCQRALAEIEELLAMAEANGQSKPHAPASWDVTELLQDVGESHLARAAAKGIDLTWHAPAGLCVHADRLKMIRVLENLVSNALKFTPRGGAVTLAASPADGAVIIEVRDTGLGMTPEQAAKLFEPFPRCVPRPTDGEPSHGIGLAASRGIVQEHGGVISVTTEKGQGSAFTVRLPNQR